MVYEVHITSTSKTKAGDWATFSSGIEATKKTLKECMEYINERYCHSKSHSTVYIDKTDGNGMQTAVAIGRIYPYTDEDNGTKFHCQDWVSIRKVDRDDVPLAEWPHMRKK